MLDQGRTRGLMEGAQSGVERIEFGHQSLLDLGDLRHRDPLEHGHRQAVEHLVMDARHEQTPVQLTHGLAHPRFVAPDREIHHAEIDDLQRVIAVVADLVVARGQDASAHVAHIAERLAHLISLQRQIAQGIEPILTAIDSDAEDDCHQ